MMKVVSFLIKILKYKVLSFLVSNFDILADSLQQLQKYKGLLDAGVITEEEFTAKKKQLLGI